MQVRAAFCELNAQLGAQRVEPEIAVAPTRGLAEHARLDGESRHRFGTHALQR